MTRAGVRRVAPPQAPLDLAETLGHGALLLGPRGRIVAASPRACALLGWSAAALRGKDAHVLLHGGHSHPAARCPWIAAIREGATLAHDREGLLTAQGDHLIVGRTLLPAPATPRHHLLVLEDLSAREAGRARLEATTREKAEIERIGGMGTFSLHLPSQTMVWSEGLFRLYRCDPAVTVPSVELLLNTMLQEDYARLDTWWHHLLASRSPVTLRYRLTRGDGTLAVFHGIFEVLRDPTGSPESVWAVIHDVTEHEELVAELSASRARLLEAEALAAVGHYDYDLRTDRTYWSPQLCAIYGVPVGSALTLGDVMSLIHPDDRASIADGIERAIASRATVDLDWRIPARPGHEARIVHGRGRVIFEDGVPVRLLGTVQDVTAQREMEAALERSRRSAAARDRLASLGTLVAGVAHEVNNPLTFMRGGAEVTLLALREVLDAEPLSPEGRAAIEEALRQQQALVRGSEHIARIAASLKQVARASTGKRDPLMLNALVDDALAVACARLSAHVRVERRHESRRPVLANASEIAQVLLNLVLNAGDALGDRPGCIRVRTWSEGPHELVEVEDDGPGIPPEVQARLFTPFYTTKPTGTGLGLSVSHSIARDHGGDLTFRSEPGKGAAFLLRLPATTG